MSRNFGSTLIQFEYVSTVPTWSILELDESMEGEGDEGKDRDVLLLAVLPTILGGP